MTTEKLLAQRPDFVQRFLRGTLKGFHWLKTNEKDVVARMIPIMKVSESEATTSIGLHDGSNAQRLNNLEPQ